MKNQKNPREIIVESISKMITDKEAVKAYMKGEISIQDLKDKGVKFAKPL